MTDEKVRVYKFYSQKWGLEALRKRRLKITTLDELNDPFEFDALDIQHTDAREFVRNAILKTNNDTGLLCFSDNWKFPVMWSHYADNHKGICLGFDVPKKLVSKIRYVERKISFGIDHHDNEYGAKLLNKLKNGKMEENFTTKFKHWEYEREYRLFERLSNRDGDYYFLNFAEDRLDLVEIVLGANYISCSDKFGMTPTWDVVVPITATKFSDNAFEIIKEEDAAKQMVL